MEKDPLISYKQPVVNPQSRGFTFEFDTYAEVAVSTEVNAQEKELIVYLSYKSTDISGSATHTLTNTQQNIQQIQFVFIDNDPPKPQKPPKRKNGPKVLVTV